MNRSATLVATAALLLIGATTPTFWDTATHPHRTAIEELQSYGVVGGYPDGSFKPYSPINRAEFLKILMLSAFGSETFSITDRRCFTDFTGREEWYWVYACAAKSRGIISGYPDGTFRGTDTIILAEALKMMLEAWNIPLPQYFREPDNWFDPYMDAAAGKGIFQIFPFVPDFTLTRGDMAALILALDESIVGTDTPEAPPLTPVPPPPGLPAVCGNSVWETGEQCDDGNTLDGDGCSSLCIVVVEPIRRGAVSIEQRTLGNISVTSGAHDVPLLQFDAAAGRQDVYITDMKFKATAGVLSNAQNYRLYFDKDNDGSAEALIGQATPQGSSLTFTNLSLLIKEGIYERVELRADMINTLSPVSLAVAFDTALSDYVAGIGTEDGQELTGIETDGSTCTISTCWVAVHTETPRVVTITVQGNLYVVKDTTVPSRQLLAGDLSPTILRLRFYATSEDILVEHLTFEGGNSSVDHLELYYDDSTQILATARTSQCSSVATGRFCALTSFVVPRNGEKKILVKVKLRADDEGAQSASTIALTLSAATSGVVAVEATGNSSGQELAQNDGDATEEGEIFVGTLSQQANSTITGSTHDIVFSRITSITDVHPDSDFTAVPSGVADIATFRFTTGPNSNFASGQNDVVLEKVVFTVVAANVTLDSSGFMLYSTSNPTLSASCTASGVSGTITVTCDNLESSSADVSIPQASTQDFVLRANVTNPHVSGVSTLQVSLSGLSDRANPGTIEWNDEVSTFDWVDVGVTNVISTLYRRS